MNSLAMLLGSVLDLSLELAEELVIRRQRLGVVLDEMAKEAVFHRLALPYDVQL